MKQRQIRNNELRSGRGIAGLVHRLVMLLLWPFRKPYIFIPLLILMYLIPTFIGARPAEVHIWYWNKIKNLFGPVSEQIVSKSKELLPESGKLSFPGLSSSGQPETPQRNIDKVIESYEAEQQLRRQIFEKAKNAETPVRVDIMAQKNQPLAPQFENEPEAKAVLPAPAPSEPETESAEPAPLPAKNTVDNSRRRKLDLIYLDTFQEINGEAYVVNANEIIIGGNDIFLFGIYVDPTSSEGIAGKEFLENLIGTDPVKCVIEAYTRQGVATGMCYVRHISINHTLVNNGISQDVAL